MTGIYGYKWSGPPYVLEVRSTGSVGPNQPDYVLEIRIIEESTDRLVGFKAFTFAEAYDATSRLSVPVNAGLHTVQYTDRYSDEFGVFHGLATIEVNVGVHPTAMEIRASADR